MESEKSLPQCVGFIMDGNRRWAKEQGLPTLVGHSAGHEVFLKMVRALLDLGIKHGAFYAFSTENWKRSQEEINYLEELFAKVLETIDEKVRFRFIGRKQDFNPSLQLAMDNLESRSHRYAETTIWIAVSYGGRDEIVKAVNEAIQKGVAVDENSFPVLLETAEMPDPDLIIRTGGEQRLSNFLTWKSVYSELFFTDTYWPAFTKAEFESILAQYAKRQRRYGA